MKDIAIGNCEGKKFTCFFILSHSFFKQKLSAPTFQSGFGQTALLEIKDNTEDGSNGVTL